MAGMITVTGEGQMRALLSMVLCTALVCACSDEGQKKRADEKEAEQALLASRNAAEELERRFIRQVKVRDDMLVVTNFVGVNVVPSIDGWRLNCGWLGVSVVFLYGRGEEASVEVQLSDGSVSTARCMDLAPSVASRVRSLLPEIYREKTSR